MPSDLELANNRCANCDEYADLETADGKLWCDPCNGLRLEGRLNPEPEPEPAKRVRKPKPADAQPEA